MNIQSTLLVIGLCTGAAGLGLATTPTGPVTITVIKDDVPGGTLKCPAVSTTYAGATVLTVHVAGCTQDGIFKGGF